MCSDYLKYWNHSIPQILQDQTLRSFWNIAACASAPLTPRYCVPQALAPLAWLQEQFTLLFKKQNKVTPSTAQVKKKIIKKIHLTFQLWYWWLPLLKINVFSISKSEAFCFDSLGMHFSKQQDVCVCFVWVFLRFYKQ